MALHLQHQIKLQYFHLNHLLHHYFYQCIHHDITITASTNMSQDDIEKAVREAEQFAAEDKARKDEVDTHNMADQMIYQTEKTLKDLEGKIDGSDKAAIESKLEALKNVAKGNDIQAIKDATEALQQAFYAASEKMYKQAGPQGGCDPNCGGSCNDDVVDADFTMK